MKTRFSLKIYTRKALKCITLLVVVCMNIDCFTKKIEVNSLTNTYFKNSYTKKEFYYYSFVYKKAAFATGVTFHFKTDSLFTFYSCNPNDEPHEGKYKIKDNSIFLSDCDYSILPKHFIFIDSNKIIGSMYVKKMNQTLIFICKKND
jgi:hypothetical protein